MSETLRGKRGFVLPVMCAGNVETIVSMVRWAEGAARDAGDTELANAFAAGLKRWDDEREDDIRW